MNKLNKRQIHSHHFSFKRNAYLTKLGIFKFSEKNNKKVQLTRKVAVSGS